MIKRLLSLIIGLAWVVIGIFILSSFIKAEKVQTAETTATIIRIDSELQTDTDGFDTRYYYPVIEYTVNGQKYEKRLSNSGTTNSTAYKVEETVTINYNPDNPLEFSEKGNKGGLIGGIVFIALGIIVTIATLIGKI